MEQWMLDILDQLEIDDLKTIQFDQNHNYKVTTYGDFTVDAKVAKEVSESRTKCYFMKDDVEIDLDSIVADSLTINAIVFIVRKA